MMKPSSLALFLLFAFIASSAKAQVVLDAEGDMVINGCAYYIMPYIWSLGGGIKLEKTGNETIPVSVVQSPSEVDFGLPWRIESPLRILQIRTNSRLAFFSVKGEVPSSVPFPSRWSAVEDENGIESVKISGFKEPITGLFKILRVNWGAYKIVYCPLDGDSCGDLGISRDENGKRHLAVVDGRPLVVVFVKAKPSEVSRV